MSEDQNIKIKKAIQSARRDTWFENAKKAGWLIVLLVFALAIKFAWDSVPYKLESQHTGVVLSTFTSQTEDGSGPIYASIELDNGDIISARIATSISKGATLSLCKMKRTLIWPQIKYKTCDALPKSETGSRQTEDTKTISELAELEVCRNFQTHDCKIESHISLATIPSISNLPNPILCELEIRVLENGKVDLLKTICNDERIIETIQKSAHTIRYETTDSCGQPCTLIGQETIYPLEINIE